MSADSTEQKYRDMDCDDLIAFFRAHPEADEHTWIDGDKVRFSDVLSKVKREFDQEIENMGYEMGEAIDMATMDD